MTTFSTRAFATLLVSGALLAGSATSRANVRVLPTQASVATGASNDGTLRRLDVGQNLSTRWTSVTETSEPGLGSGVRATFERAESFVWSDFSSEVDASQYEGMYFVLKNAGTTPSQSSVELHCAYQPHTNGKFLTSIGLKPGETKRGVVYFHHEYADKQMTVHPPLLDIPAQILHGGEWNWNKAKLRGWLMWNTGGPATVELKDLRLVKRRRDLTGIIDAYGQKADLAGDWKVTSDGELVDRDQAEADTLAMTSDSSNAAGKTAHGTTTATGKWRFERAKTGNWFAVDPSGKRTWITGANNVMMDGRMILDDKEEMYASLPPREGPFGQFYGITTYFRTGQNLRNFDMYRANLYKKHGQSYEAKWRHRMEQRLKKWGINAMAGTLDGGMIQGGTPYVKNVYLYGGPAKLVVPNNYWAHPNDPYAPQFATWTLSEFRHHFAAEIASPPRNLIGVAVGNEETWGFLHSERSAYQIPIAALNAAPSQPCKLPLLDVLKRKHVTIANLNAAWGTNFASWEAMRPANAYGSPTITPGMRADLKLMLTTYADKFYSTVRAQLLKAGYRGLFLGTRDALDQTPDEVLAVQAKYVDAHTINSYESDDATWARIAKLTKPVLLTEFSFSAVDRGHNSPNKGFEVGTQEERAEKVRGYLDKAASLKNVAGVFFYGFAECPFSGRWSDDERLNVGLVDITDTPYWDVVNAFRSFGTNLPNVRKYR